MSLYVGVDLTSQQALELSFLLQGHNEGEPVKLFHAEDRVNVEFQRSQDVFVWSPDTETFEKVLASVGGDDG